MTRTNEGAWTTLLQGADAEVEYKYVVLTDPELEGRVQQDRTLDVAADAPASCTVVDDLGRGTRSVAEGRECDAQRAGDRLGKCRFELVVEDVEVLQVHVVGEHPALGDWHHEGGVPLEREGGSSLWVADAELPRNQDIAYKFVVWRAAGSSVADGASARRSLHIPTEGRKMLIKDRVGQESQNEDKSKPAVTMGGASQSCLCTFDLQVDGASAGMSVSLLGSHDFLGEWQLARAVPMIPREHGTFSASMHLPVNTDLEYKFVVMAAPEGESCERLVRLDGDVTVTRDCLFDRTGRVFPPPLEVRRLTVQHQLCSADSQGEQREQTERTDVATERTDVARPGTRDAALQPTPHSTMCTFKVRGGLEDGMALGIVGNADALGCWNLDTCVRLQAVVKEGRTEHTVSVPVPAGKRLEYRYVLLRAPRWEEYRGNRRLAPGRPPAAADCDWRIQRRDNVHLVRRVLDGVGGATAQDFSPASSPPVVETVEGEWCLEPLDPALCDSVLVTVVVEVAGSQLSPPAVGKPATCCMLTSHPPKLFRSLILQRVFMSLWFSRGY